MKKNIYSLILITVAGLSNADQDLNNIAHNPKDLGPENVNNYYVGSNVLPDIQPNHPRVSRSNVPPYSQQTKHEPDELHALIDEIHKWACNIKLPPKRIKTIYEIQITKPDTSNVIFEVLNQLEIKELEEQYGKENVKMIVSDRE